MTHHILADSLSAQAADKLTIIKAGPVGEVANIAEANEIRVVFSEPMIVVGKIPKVVSVPWFHVAPAIAGTFRWSGTTTLIFTPDPKIPLPFATRYDVTTHAISSTLAEKLPCMPPLLEVVSHGAKTIGTPQQGRPEDDQDARLAGTGRRATCRGRAPRDDDHELYLALAPADSPDRR